MSKRGESSTNAHRIECCPSETRRIEPLGGISRDGKLLELYRDKWTIQRLDQTTCLPKYLNRRCRLVDATIKPWSRCVQKYSYVYAFVKDFNVTQHYRLDYVKVRSGCACEVDFNMHN
ncbi:hypothetical protein BaRGS_00016141 [Batillaria attramentaria]|uniref:Spaetzle domain-containing protein n=1 Tax=Batillaria attramentaria TaxID=370345 RepID=A0ABD0KZP0_9CAEN